MENLVFSIINIICGDFMVRDGVKKVKDSVRFYKIYNLMWAVYFNNKY